ncbi:MAG: DUF4296 domain-containing protein [Bacteroidota bacterium]
MAFCLMLASCGDKKDVPSTEAAIPADSLISGEKMIHILADVQIIEAGLAAERNEGAPPSKPGIYYKAIFKKYHISQVRYEQNMRYYSQNPAKMSKLYDKVIAELETRQKMFRPGR